VSEYDDGMRFWKGLAIASLVSIVLWVLIFIAADAAFGTDTVRVSVPVCEEDERYLKGKGDFDGTSWSRYVCIPTEEVER